MKKRIWIVGGSSGIGLQLVKQWLKKGNYLIVSSRSASKTDELIELQKEYPSNLRLIDLDVTQNDVIKNVVQMAWNTYNGLDIWFYNAGTYESMKLEKFDLNRFEQMNFVNYLGVIRVMVHIVPLFKEQKSGRWIWNSSLSSYFGLPYGGGYSAPKAALVNLAQSLQPELLNEGIELQIINHGFVKTRLTKKNDFEMPELMEPEYAAEQIIEKTSQPYRFEIHFPFKLSLFLRTIALLPYNFALSITKKMLK